MCYAIVLCYTTYMQTTIYIRKENEDRWNNISDKSAWVNAYLEKNPPNSVVIKKGLEPDNVPKIINTPEDVKKIFPEAKPVKTKPPVTYTPKTNWGA